MGGYPNTTINPTPSPMGGGGYVPFDLVSAGIGYLSDQHTNKMNLKREREARKWNLEQWHRQNKYNHPTEQMARLVSAGLNPNLIYGSSPGSAVGNAGSVAPGKAAEYRLGNPMIPFMDTRVKQAQSNNLDTLSTLNDIKTLGQIEDNRRLKSEADVAEGTVGANIEIANIKAKLQYEKLLQEELQTLALSQKDNGIIARYAIGTMEARINKNAAAYKQNVDALHAYLADKGITPNSYNWAKIMAILPGFTGKIDFDNKGFQNWKNKQNR